MDQGVAGRKSTESATKRSELRMSECWIRHSVSFYSWANPAPGLYEQPGYHGTAGLPSLRNLLTIPT
jgi:hypothetical protein